MSAKRRHVSLTEAAEYLDVSPRTIRRWISKGALTAYRVGPRIIRVDLAEIDKLLQPIGGAA